MFVREIQQNLKLYQTTWPETVNRMTIAYRYQVLLWPQSLNGTRYFPMNDICGKWILFSLASHITNWGNSGRIANFHKKWSTLRTIANSLKLIRIFSIRVVSLKDIKNLLLSGHRNQLNYFLNSFSVSNIFAKILFLLRAFLFSPTDVLLNTFCSHKWKPSSTVATWKCLTGRNQ